MNEQNRPRLTDAEIAARLHDYADAAEREVPSAPAPTGQRPWWRSPLAGFAAAAALVVVVVSAALTVGGSDDEVITPADDGRSGTVDPVENRTPSVPMSVPGSVPDSGSGGTSVPVYTEAPPIGPRLHAPTDDEHLVTFDSIGPYADGMEVPMDDPGVSYDPSFQPGCGAWYPQGVPGQSEADSRGLVLGIGSPGESVPFTVGTLYVSDPAYRTASGVGVGTDLESLRWVYGSDLVVDRLDGWENPTDGLLASYRDVAAVRDGDRALTFTLENDVVTEVKVSEADFWGDDEGCV